ncbi:hypothetical protein [Mesorhizobium sp.]|uniref:hypothetical protein n=1 Tax=Mesorhizobium sp. TaxID=1871066 RepID=UPI0025C65792|nr:hypothetical protein [Mesorhizobium sp.]
MFVRTFCLGLIPPASVVLGIAFDRVFALLQFVALLEGALRCPDARVAADIGVAGLFRFVLVSDHGHFHCAYDSRPGCAEGSRQSDVEWAPPNRSGAARLWPSAANEQWLVFITLLAAERCGNAGDESANDHRQGADQRESGTRLPGRSAAAFA